MVCFFFKNSHAIFNLYYSYYLFYVVGCCQAGLVFGLSSFILVLRESASLSIVKLPIDIHYYQQLLLSYSVSPLAGFINDYQWSL